MKKQSITLGVLGIIAAVIVLTGYRDEKVNGFHSYDEILMYQQIQNDLPEGSNALFTGSGKCAGCHGEDLQGIANITEGGWDVNPTDYWRASIMGNSAKDPFWRAKVTHEVSVNPSHQLELEDKCTSCHAPLGHFNAHYVGQEHYTYVEMLNDSLALDGVSCNACHQQDPDGIGQSFSGELSFVTDTVYGPFGGGKEEEPIVGQPMTAFVGFEPLYGNHIVKSELCAGCHTLVTNTVDLDGNSTGDTFVEQATYHEWLNSVYGDPFDDESQECQGCHMPKVNEEVIISANYPWLPSRGPIGLHTMVGANTFMLEMMQSNMEELGISATEAQFDSTIAKTYEMLQQQSVVLSVSERYAAEDSVDFDVLLTNIAGHKFPSGYPARRAFVEFVAVDENGNTLFQSGTMGADYEVNGQNETYEPHYDIIRAEEDVQIYEQVLGDVNLNVTTVLERAYVPLKDNRLVPKGFSSTHFAYDTTAVVGAALDDDDFNFQEEEEGSGTDLITYRVGLDGYDGNVTAFVKVWYQAAPPKWMEEMFSFSTPEIEYFENLYWEQGADPVLVTEGELTVSAVGVSEEIENSLAVYPNPTADGIVRFSLEGQFVQGQQYFVYASNGKLVASGNINGVFEEIQLPDAAGTYFLSVEVAGSYLTRSIIRL